MKDFKTGLKQWLWIATILSTFIIVCWIWHYLIKADRLTTKSTTDATPAWSLYSTAWTALSAQKWNELVDKSKANFVKQVFTDGDFSLNTTEQAVGTINITTANNPILVTVNGSMVNWSTPAGIDCYIYIDWVNDKWNWWCYVQSLPVSSRWQVSINYITNNLSVGSHSIVLKCISWASWTKFKKTTSYPLSMAVIELRQ